jgi:hypothetical protein
LSAVLKEDTAELPAAVPSGLERIVRRCLEKRPEDRFESARDLAFSLEQVANASEQRHALRNRLQAEAEGKTGHGRDTFV